jgi:hypothetical protein
VTDHHLGVSVVSQVLLDPDFYRDQLQPVLTDLTIQWLYQQVRP